MPWTLFDKITSLFDKSFLFAAFLPTLIFLVAIGATLSLVVGVDAAFSWFAALEATQKAAATTTAIAGAVVLAYVAAGVRPALVAFWSGTLRHAVLSPFYGLAESWQRVQFDALCARAERPRVWERLLVEFRTEAGRSMQIGGPRRAVDATTVDRLSADIHRLSANAGVADVKHVGDQVAESYQRYLVAGLEPVYAPFLSKLKERVEREQQAERNARSERDRQFGHIATLRATRLGNVAESYMQYSSRRYGMEGDVFWPALRSVVPKDYMQVLDESRVYVDFGVTMATYAAVYGLLTLWAGPWIWWNPPMWGALSAGGFVIAYAFYWVAVMSVTRYGDIHRACIDLHRLALMKALHRERPASLRAERAQWLELSQLSVYGDAEALDFPIAAEK